MALPESLQKPDLTLSQVPSHRFQTLPWEQNVGERAQVFRLTSRAGSAALFFYVVNIHNNYMCQELFWVLGMQQ